ncbi:MAG: hypothetical protein P4L76_00120 [Beijerinckiaceae bacterium]|nr:hypothetical protein [Beijerinckiaceae bacterium]
MNRIVREHYPVAELPENLREGFDPGQVVRVIVEATASPVDEKRGGEPFSLEALFEKARPSFANMEEVSAHIHAMRDEWDAPR